MIWFTVLRSYKDAHAKKIVQRTNCLKLLCSSKQNNSFKQFEKADAEILDRREQHTASYSIGRIHPCHTKIRCEDA